MPAWWHKYGFTSLTELRNYAAQMGARAVDVVSHGSVNGRRFDAALIDNANAEERRMRGHYAALIDANQNPRGIFSSHLKVVDGAVLVNLNGQRSAEVASALKVLHLPAGGWQRALWQIPLLRAWQVDFRCALQQCPPG